MFVFARVDACIITSLNLFTLICINDHKQYLTTGAGRGAKSDARRELLR